MTVPIEVLREESWPSQPLVAVVLMGGSWEGHEGRHFSSFSLLERRGLPEIGSIIYYYILL